MNEINRELDLALAECEQENRLLRARNDRLTEHAEGLQRDYDLLLAEYNLLRTEHKQLMEKLDDHPSANNVGN
jgi:hypothetical protein